MRQLAALLVGEVLLLGGLAVWFWPAACVVAGGQLVFVGLTSEIGGKT
jgi:hypothetical protein